MNDSGKHSEDEEETKPLKLSFRAIKKPVTLRHDVPLDFKSRPSEPGIDEDDDEPMILDVQEAASRGKCIVCYKPIYEADLDVFTCPNCGREAHYLCATIFITEYSICPVCSTRLHKDKETGKYVVSR